MSTNHTTNYNLNQWAATDKVLRTEFNEDNEKIDAALKSHDDELAGLEAAIGAKGNCKIYTTSYIGDGTYGESSPNSITFPSEPVLVFIGSAGDDGRELLALRGTTKAYAQASGYSLITLNWNGNTLMWSNHLGASSQLNNSGTTYVVVGLLASGE